MILNRIKTTRLSENTDSSGTPYIQYENIIVKIILQKFYFEFMGIIFFWVLLGPKYIILQYFDV